MITYAVSLSIFLASGGVVQATSLPQTWPTLEACEQEAESVREHVQKDRGLDADKVKVHCFRAIVDDDDPPRVE